MIRMINVLVAFFVFFSFNSFSCHLSEFIHLSTTSIDSLHTKYTVQVHIGAGVDPLNSNLKGGDAGTAFMLFGFKGMSGGITVTNATPSVTSARNVTLNLNHRPGLPAEYHDYAVSYEDPSYSSSYFECVDTNLNPSCGNILPVRSYNFDFTVAHPINNPLSKIQLWGIEGEYNPSSITSPAGCDWDSDMIIDFNNLMAVTWSELSAEVRDHAVYLQWSTTDEIHNKAFEIRRLNFLKNEYEIIGSVNSSSSKRYNFTDQEPFFGYNVYRIFPINLDGSYEKGSRIVSLAYGVPSDKEVAIYPNPIINGSFHSRFNSALSTKALVQITDVAGKVWYKEQKEIFMGSNDLAYDVQHLTKGIYILTINMNGVAVSKKIIIQ